MRLPSRDMWVIIVTVIFLAALPAALLIEKIIRGDRFSLPIGKVL